MAQTILTVKNLVTSFVLDQGEAHAVDDVSFTVDQGEVLGIVGESGCGKSVTSLSIMRLIQKPGYIKSGEIIFNGINLLEISDAEMRKIRGNKMTMIFQEPMTALNPVYTCGNQIEEVFKIHQPHLSPKQRKEKTIEILKKVGIPSPERRYHEYPHQLSGGMRQRIMIAMAIVCDPLLLIADEPTTALDVTIQAQVLELIKELRKQSQMAMILITHDLGIVAEMCDKVAVMYGGKIIEYGPTDMIFAHPRHPYTLGLLRSIPSLHQGPTKSKLYNIPGSVPSLWEWPQGCRFYKRCERARDNCQRTPPMLTTQDGHQVACYYPITT
ncbi:MAG: ABC transporter ATP-binding protein [Bdellovibrionaceae bacterium]|nr:ABC transporter ATP-binding protein [Pseudobdellovibrionaceae bacterium]MDW8190539.1 ABC transporter ATP-binding protein [Pseudobdellovibrionaceae bacterium]